MRFLLPSVTKNLSFVCDLGKH